MCMDSLHAQNVAPAITDPAALAKVEEERDIVFKKCSLILPTLHCCLSMQIYLFYWVILKLRLVSLSNADL